MRRPPNLLRGGDSGPAVAPGDPERSLLFRAVLPGAEPHMPPKGYQLTEDEISLLKLWIARGADAGPQAGGRAGEGGEPWAEAGDNLVPAQVVTVEPPAGLTASEAIDFYIARRWKEQGIEPAPLCDDAAFVRRVYLDLAGRIPTPEEARVFVEDHGADKRVELVDALLSGSAFARRMREVFDVVFLGRGSGREDRRRERRGREDRQREERGWHDYLEWAFRVNRPWDRMVKDMLLARPEEEETRSAVWYLYARRDNHQEIAESVAPSFFGLQMQCAQCHNHPLASEIKQKHYWGMVAFFNRSKNVDTPAGPGLAESAVGGFVKFANLKKESQPALLTFLNGVTVPEERPEENAKEEESPELYLVPPKGDPKKLEVVTVPKFSRRETFAELATSANPLLGRALVNRAWGLMMGRGLVHPVDKMDSGHPPSHPDLLSWLTRHVEDTGYDFRGLIRTLALSEAYQRSSRWAGPVRRPLPESFACGLEKPMMAEDLYRSWRVATEAAKSGDADAWTAGWDRHGPDVAAVFPDVFPEDYNADLRQALFLSNNPLLESMVAPAEGNLSARLLSMKGPRERIRAAFVAVLGRSCDEEEMRRALAFWSGKLENSEAAVSQLVWALLTSAEFVFNH